MTATEKWYLKIDIIGRKKRDLKGLTTAGKFCISLKKTNKKPKCELEKKENIAALNVQQKFEFDKVEGRPKDDKQEGRCSAQHHQWEREEWKKMFSWKPERKS